MYKKRIIDSFLNDKMFMTRNCIPLVIMSRKMLIIHSHNLKGIVISKSKLMLNLKSDMSDLKKVKLDSLSRHPKKRPSILTYRCLWLFEDF